jgi:hypothetical protein
VIYPVQPASTQNGRRLVQRYRPLLLVDQWMLVDSLALMQQLGIVPVAAS